jgi:hypothetical protein
LIGCELVRFNAVEGREDAGGIEHIQRWKRFAERLASTLGRSGLGEMYGGLHPKDASADAFDGLLREQDRLIAEIVDLVRSSRGRAKTVASFGPKRPILAKFVKRLFFRKNPFPTPALWWYSTLRSGEVADPLPALETIVGSKDRKAVGWVWRAADDRWLLIVGEAQSLEDTMVLEGRIEGFRMSVQPLALTRVFAWDGFSERIYQVHPSVGLVFEVDPAGRSVIHRKAYPDSVRPFCDLLTHEQPH